MKIVKGTLFFVSYYDEGILLVTLFLIFVARRLTALLSLMLNDNRRTYKINILTLTRISVESLTRGRCDAFFSLFLFFFESISGSASISLVLDTRWRARRAFYGFFVLKFLRRCCWVVLTNYLDTFGYSFSCLFTLSHLLWFLVTTHTRAHGGGVV